MLFFFAMFITSSCEVNDLDNEISYEFETTATDKPILDSPGSGDDNEDDDPY